MEKHYIINEFTMYWKGEPGPNGKCTRVTETAKTFLVDMSPKEILEDSIKCIGFNLKGAMETSKFIVGKQKNLRPVMVNPIQQICVFPTKSVKHDDAIWINPTHIRRTGSSRQITIVEFTNGHTLMIPSKLASFNNKVQTAEQLRNITIEIGKDPTSFIIDPHKRHMFLRKK